MKKFRRFVVLVAVVMMAVAVQAQKFAILSDIHVTPGNANEAQLRKAVAEINACDADAVLMTGDLTTGGRGHELRPVHEDGRRPHQAGRPAVARPHPA